MELAEVFDTSKWREAPLEYIQKSFGAKRDDLRVLIWRNTKNDLSPLTVYKYLKARFGLPNGALMFTKNFGTTENLNHWHYHLLSGESEIHFIGKSAGLEIMLKLKVGVSFKKSDWNELVEHLKSSFADQGKEMSSIQNKLEHYTLFINPFARLDGTLRDLRLELEKLDIREVHNNINDATTEEERKKYFNDFKTWVANVERAVSVGSTIRMLCPVLCEAFINLLILVLRKEEIKKDKRLYDDLLRRQIDIRVKSLHLYCNSFLKPVNSEDQRFKDFHTLMNQRNDFLHGNIDPQSLMFEDVFFDMGDTPLFKEDGGIIFKTMKNYLKNVEPEQALKDHQTSMKFIAFVLDHLEPDVSESLSGLMRTRMPAFNRKTEGIAILFSPGLAEDSFGLR